MDSKKKAAPKKASAKKDSKATRVKVARKNYEKVAKTTKPGTGKRFSALESSIEAEGKSPEAAKKIAASAGWKKYKGKMGTMAAKGRKK